MKNVIGWQEMVAIPQWRIPRMRAKMDTGARSSAIDVGGIEEIGDNRVRFEVVYRRGNTDKRQSVDAIISRQTNVRSSNGQVQKRYMVVVPVKIGPVEKPVEFSLVCRKHMICRVILGRKALENDFIVDASHRYMLGAPRRRSSRSLPVSSTDKETME